MDSAYLCIDLKSFYASVECVERGLDPLQARLVVADTTRTEKTICLAVSPALKALGVKNRCRLFEIPKSIDYIIAPPRMQKYIDYSATIYGIYLKYVAVDDIHVYSIDEAFLDVTSYQKLYDMTPWQMASMINRDILQTTGITATAGGGPNLYLAKIALDIMAKKTPGHIAWLNQEQYEQKLWDHEPITDFWRIGPGTARRLADLGIYNMGQLAHSDESAIMKTFGIDGRFLLDHAIGVEPVTIKEIKAYQSRSHSLSSGQVIGTDCDWERGRLLLQEMVDQLSLDMTARQVVTSTAGLYVGCKDQPSKGGAIRLCGYTNSRTLLMEAYLQLYDRLVDRTAKIGRLGLNCDAQDSQYESYDLFADQKVVEKDKHLQKTLLDIRQRYGVNAVIKGMDLLPQANGIERNLQIGGHKSGNETKNRRSR